MRALALFALVTSWRAEAAPPGWTVNSSASRLGFVASVGGQLVSGQFRRWSARINFAPDALNGSRVVVIVDTRSAVTGNAVRDQMLPSSDWFAAATFPQATFVATRFRNLGGGNYQAIGSLYIKGVRRVVMLPFHIVINGGQAHMTGQLDLNRTAFGVGQGEWRAENTVRANVRVNVVIDASRQ